MHAQVAVVGGGLVGAAFALALGQSGRSVLLLEASASEERLDPAAAWDSRIYAISPGARRFLESLGVWTRLEPGRAGPVLRMEVHGDAGGLLNFAAHQAGLDHLATIVESSNLAQALDSALADCAMVTRLSPAEVLGLRLDSGRVSIEICDGRAAVVELMVGADGARSWVRRTMGIDATVEPYGQSAVVANFATEQAHGATAWQWFGCDDVFAWLPLPGQHVSLVWSCPTGQAQALIALDAPKFTARVAQRGGDRLGAMRLVTPPRLFPLTKLVVDDLIGPRVALIGDAAHVLHPLAGQGLNLGLADAACLASILQSPEAADDCGNPRLLRRYRRSRKADILALTWATHGLSRLFGHPDSAVGSLRNIGLNLVEHLPVLKQSLIQRALR